MADLSAALRACSDADRDIRVVVIRGKGRAFSTGADLKWLASGVLADPAAHMRFQDEMQQAYELIENSGVVVISSVNGLALAGGFELALSCDIVIADEEAELGDEHIRKNLLPSGGSSQRLSRKIGIARSLFYLLTGRRMTGREAERIGLVSVSVPGSDLAAMTLALATELAEQGSPCAGGDEAHGATGCRTSLAGRPLARALDPIPVPQ